MIYIEQRHRQALWMLLAVILLSAKAEGQSLFVQLATASSAPTTTTIAPPAGNPYSAAAPVTGTTWNVVGRSVTVASGTGVGTNSLYSGLALKNATNGTSTATLSVAYVVPSGTTLTAEPSAVSGENTLQPGGIMQGAWRNYDNGAGKYFVFAISNLPAATPYALYFCGATTTSGQGVGLTVFPVNAYNGNSTNGETANVTANSNGSYGSLWTVAGGTTNLQPQGTTWNVLYGQSDATGTFRFLFNGASSYAYFNGFQLVPLAAPVISGLTNQAVLAGNNATLTAMVTALPAATLQWNANGIALSGQTNTSLVLNAVTAAQNGTVYSLVASNWLGLVTNSLTLTVTVPPAITGLNNQAVPVGSTVVMAATVSGYPAPALHWQRAGVNVSNGSTGNGSVIAGSTSSTLNLTNAQTADSGIYSLIATNSVGLVTNSLTLTVSAGNVAPDIAGLTGQTVVQNSNAIFSASVSGLPLPTLRWLVNGAVVTGATNASLTVTNVAYAQNGSVYSLIASNTVGQVTNSVTLTVLVPPTISASPTNLTVLSGQTATFTVSASGVPAPGYQWYFNRTPQTFANGATYAVGAATIANAGNYYVVVTNSVGVVTSSVAVLQVDSPMVVTQLAPANGATGICYDTPLYLTFTGPPVLQTPGTGKIRIYNVTNSTTPVDTLDMSLNVTLETPYAVNVQSRTIGGETFYNFPVIITGNTAAIYPHLDVLTSNQTYYVTVDSGVFADTNGASFAGITATNVWKFTTKPTGPANATNLVVAQDNSGDFATVQGAIDAVPANNTTPTLINLHNGTYTEIVEAHAKNNLTFLGQSQTGTVIAYANNGNLNASTHTEIVFKVSANDIALENLTVDDTSGVSGSQGETLMIDSGAARFIANNINIEGYQDTILANQSSSIGYFNNSMIQGSVDFIWGGGTLFFTNCQVQWLISGGEGPNPSPGSSDINSNGFSFVNCSLTTAAGVSSCLIGRSRSITNGNTALIGCQISTNIGGWSSDCLPTNNFRNWYYGCSNLVTGAAATLSNGVALAAGSAALSLASSATAWLNGWQPQLPPAIYGQPVSQTVAAGQTVTLSVGAMSLPPPSAYQWQLNGTNVPGATNPVYTVANVYPKTAGNYTVLVSNTVGNVVSHGATVSLATVGPIPVPQYNYLNILNITNYGAVGDGVTTNTTAIQNAINAATLGGLTNSLRGGTVEIPAGTYLSGPITLYNNVNLQIDAGAMLQMLPFGSYPGGITNPPDFIFAQSVHDFAITGPGIIDGNGAAWQNAIETNSAVVRPRALFAPQTCTNFLVQDVTLQNPANTHISLRYVCTNVMVNGININTPDGTHNTDGIDVSASGFWIANSHISDGDDHVAIGQGQNIVITNCLFGTGHGVSIGSFTSSGVSNLLVINCVWTNGSSGIHLKSDDDRGGLVQNLQYLNLSMTNTAIPIFFYSYYTNAGTTSGATPAQAASYAAVPVTATTPIWRNITISNLTAVAAPASSNPAGIIWGKPEMSFSNVVMDRINIQASNYFQIYNAQGIQLNDSQISTATTNALAVYNAGLTISNTVPSANGVEVDGLTSNGIGNTLLLYGASAILFHTNVLAGPGNVVLGAGTLTISNNFNLAAADTFSFQLGTNAALVNVLGNLALGGSCNVSAGGGFTDGTYPLFAYTGSVAGVLPTLGTVPSGHDYAITTNLAGWVDLVVSPSVPGVPANLTAQGTNLLVNLGWNASTGATGYRLQRSVTNGAYVVIASVTGTNYADSAVNPGTAYAYEVLATNAAGASAASLPATAMPLPSAVATNLTVHLVAGQFQLTWPADHLGWRLLMQTNPVGHGLGTNWFTVPASTNFYQTNLLMNPTSGSVFLRLVYP